MFKTNLDNDFIYFLFSKAAQSAEVVEYVNCTPAKR